MNILKIIVLVGIFNASLNAMEQDGKVQQIKITLMNFYSDSVQYQIMDNDNTLTMGSVSAAKGKRKGFTTLTIKKTENGWPTLRLLQAATEKGQFKLTDNDNNAVVYCFSDGDFAKNKPNLN